MDSVSRYSNCVVSIAMAIAICKPLRSALASWLFMFVLLALAITPTSRASDTYQCELLPSDGLLDGWLKYADQDIPERYWGKGIRELHPIRVFDDRVNIAVVLNEAPDTVSGIYFCRRESSYLPADESGRVFILNDKSKHLEFSFSKK